MMPAPKLAEVAFEEFLKELPADYAEQAREFKAFTRSRKVRTPADLLQLVMLYCGLDQALRTTAGSFTLWQERLTDTAIRQRLMACGPWLKALLHRMLPAAMTAVTGFRLLVVDGSSLQGPGATGTDYRVHLVLDLTNLTLHVVQVTGVEGAESLARYPWQAGDIVLADRGYNQPQVILELSARQVWVVVRLMPTAMPLYLREMDEAQRDPAAARLDVAAHLRAATGDTVTVPVWLRGQQTSGPGWLHAVRLPPAAAAAARQRCRKVAKRKGWTPSAAALFLTGWMMVFTTVPPDAVDGRAVRQCGAGYLRAGRRLPHQARRDGAFAPFRTFDPSPTVDWNRQVRGKRFGRGECPVRPLPMALSLIERHSLERHSPEPQ